MIGRSASRFRLLLVLLGLSASVAYAQSDPSAVAPLPYLSEHPPSPVLLTFPLPTAFMAGFRTSPYVPTAEWRELFRLDSGQAFRYAADDLAFFCRLEVKLEKTARLPVRFRLGDVQAVDYLEGKFSGWRYGY